MGFIEEIRDFYNQRLYQNPMETLQKYILPLEFLHEAQANQLERWLKVCEIYQGRNLPNVRREVLDKNAKSISDVIAFRKTSAMPYDMQVVREYDL